MIHATTHDKMQPTHTPHETVLLGVVADIMFTGEHNDVQWAVVKAPPWLVALGHGVSEIGGIPQGRVEARHCGHAALAWDKP